MALDKIKLRKLIKFILEVSNEEGNEWCKAELLAGLAPTIGSSQTDRLLELSSELKRTKAFVNLTDRRLRIEAKDYYSTIKSHSLKNSLILDYREMQNADSRNDVIEFTRRLMLQLENCLNMVCKEVEAHQKVKDTPNKYKEGNSNLRKGQYSFFNQDDTQKPFKSISTPSKMFFIKKYYNFNYSYETLNDMIRIRNTSSHRGELNREDENFFSMVKRNSTKYKATYFNFFDIIISKMTDLHHPLSPRLV